MDYLLFIISSSMQGTPPSLCSSYRARGSPGHPRKPRILHQTPPLLPNQARSARQGDRKQGTRLAVPAELPAPSGTHYLLEEVLHQAKAHPPQTRSGSLSPVVSPPPPPPPTPDPHPRLQQLHLRTYPVLHFVAQLDFFALAARQLHLRWVERGRKKDEKA